ncbi:MAG: serine/threonine protein kinase, partial [Planctomycetota bacterium]
MSPDDHPTTDPPAADAPTVASRAAPAPAPRLRPGDRVGPYTIRDVLGEGGFAVVYRADQAEPVRRTVALKIIKLGMDTRQVIARFEAERQALAVMDHPNVARVLDAGATDTGRPYFVMELVAGDPITDYCDRHRLRTRERLDLFIQTCRAVQHAHQKGIIHRDIKPSNVLVTVRESDPVVKVIDFGIAKATRQQLTERTIFTEHGQFIGTPEYMSPEQAEMRALDIDTRTDIYSLGVLLYELLTATLPFDPEALRAAGYAEIQRIIREQDPPRPSTKLSSLREATTTIAQRHASDPKTLLRVLRGDLDWITMRCLEKDRTRRYESAGGLAADIRRHLDDEPVLAGPPSAGYRIGKFVRRHRGAVAAAGALVLVLALGVAGTTWGLLRAVANERVARTEAAKAQQIAAFTQEMLAGIDPATAGDLDKTLMRMVLDEAAARIGTDLADEPEVEASIRQTIGRSYVAIGEYDRAEPHLERSRELRRTVLGDEHRATLRAMNTLAGVHWRRGRYEDAAALQRETLEIQERVLGDEHPDTLASLSNLAGQYADLGRADEAEPLY